MKKVEIQDSRRLNWAAPRVFELERQPRLALLVHVRFRRNLVIGVRIIE